MSEKTKAEFVKKVDYYNNATFGIPTFELPDGVLNCTNLRKKPLPIYATYLYDSVMLYSKALANVTSTIDVNGEFFDLIKQTTFLVILSCANKNWPF